MRLYYFDGSSFRDHINHISKQFEIRCYLYVLDAKADTKVIVEVPL